jgi:3-oxoacyl-[acyl-carrier protein] reductase
MHERTHDAAVREAAAGDATDRGAARTSRASPAEPEFAAAAGLRSGLAGLVVLITGASGGIGQALAHVFAAEGAHLALLGGRRLAELRAWVDAQRFAVPVACDAADIRDAGAVERAVGRLAAALAPTAPAPARGGTASGAGEAGGAADRPARIDVAVVNAGVWPAADEPLHRMDPERARDTVEVNLLGAMWTARAVLARLAETGPRADGRGASLCFIGSTAGRFGEAGHSDYAATKAALGGLVRSLKNEITRLDPAGRVNMVEPGWTVTPMAEATLATPGTITRVVQTMAMQQLARPEDIARAVAVLSSPRLSRHVSGEVLTVAGGMEGRRLWRDDEVDEARVRDRLAPDAAGDAGSP